MGFCLKKSLPQLTFYERNAITRVGFTVWHCAKEQLSDIGVTKGVPGGWSPKSK